MTRLDILFVDDDLTYLKQASEDLEEMLEERGIASQVVAKDNVGDGIKELQSGNFHLVVVDLVFKGSGRSGNEIIEAIRDTKILPIIVLSAFRYELEEQFEQHGMIYNAKSKMIDEVVDKICEWHNRGVFNLFSEAGFLGSALRTTLLRTMWEHVSRYWDHIETENTAVLDRIAGRIAATLFYDVLASTPGHAGDGGEVPIHHGEIYIFSTPRRYLAVGDILKREDNLFIVLSPSCDLVVRPGGGAKAEQVLLAYCHDLGSFMSQNKNISSQIKIYQEKTGKSKRGAAERLARLMRQDWENPVGQYFFLPPFAHFAGGVVDFLKIRVEPYCIGDTESLLTSRIVSLNREMAAELATRFARYMIRLGQPVYERDSLIQAMLDTIPKPTDATV